MAKLQHTVTRRAFVRQVVGSGILVAGVHVGLVESAAAAIPWPRTLQFGDRGRDVGELQIRVAGWAADSPSQTFVGVDGVFGPMTDAAVRRFQSAYGLPVDGIVDEEVQAVLNSLESGDHSTAHFDWTEFASNDGSGFSGGKVDATTVKKNVRRLMYKLEALRKKAGDRPVTINSGFRSIAWNEVVGGAPNSQHMYGIASDIVVSGKTPSQVREIARTCGFSGIILYDTFVHVDSRIEYPYGAQAWYWA